MWKCDDIEYSPVKSGFVSVSEQLWHALKFSSTLVHVFFLICADFLQFWIGNETPTANDLRFRGQWGFGSMWSMSPSLSRKTASGQPLQAPLFHVPLKYKMGTIMRPDICKIPRAPGALHCWVSNLSHAPATESPVAGFWKRGKRGNHGFSLSNYRFFVFPSKMCSPQELLGCEEKGNRFY